MAICARWYKSSRSLRREPASSNAQHFERTATRQLNFGKHKHVIAADRDQVSRGDQLLACRNRWFSEFKEIKFYIIHWLSIYLQKASFNKNFFSLSFDISMLVSQLQPHKRLPGGERAENAPLAPVALGGSRWLSVAAQCRPRATSVQHPLWFAYGGLHTVECGSQCGSHPVWSTVTVLLCARQSSADYLARQIELANSNDALGASIRRSLRLLKPEKQLNHSRVIAGDHSRAITSLRVFI